MWRVRHLTRLHATTDHILSQYIGLFLYVYQVQKNQKESNDLVHEFVS